jgi:hypothetical protein
VLDDHDSDPVSPPTRDSVTALAGDIEPTIVSISDIHGFVGEAKSALLTLQAHPDYEPIVETDAARRLQWVGGEEYVLVFNGDLIDRGPASERVVEMVERLIDQAPPGHVRVTTGNHEMSVLTPDLYDWPHWYSGQRSAAERHAFIDQILDGHVVAAYEGYGVTYSHAGQPDAFGVTDVNDALVAGAKQLKQDIGEPDPYDRQEAVIDVSQRVFGFDGETGRGPNAGLTWLDFEHMPEDAPPQVVGHTRQDAPVRRGSVICQNVIRENRREDGGEAVIVETPDGIEVLGRDDAGNVETHVFSVPAIESSSIEN